MWSQGPGWVTLYTLCNMTERGPATAHEWWHALPRSLMLETPTYNGADVGLRKQNVVSFYYPYKIIPKMHVLSLAQIISTIFWQLFHSLNTKLLKYFKVSANISLLLPSLPSLPAASPRWPGSPGRLGRARCPAWPPPLPGHRCQSVWSCAQTPAPSISPSPSTTSQRNQAPLEQKSDNLLFREKWGALGQSPGYASDFQVTGDC